MLRAVRGGGGQEEGGTVAAPPLCMLQCSVAVTFAQLSFGVVLLLLFSARLHRGPLAPKLLPGDSGSTRHLPLPLARCLAAVRHALVLADQGLREICSVLVGGSPGNWAVRGLYW